jgi:hypothetical protein
MRRGRKPARVFLIRYFSGLEDLPSRSLSSLDGFTIRRPAQTNRQKLRFIIYLEQTPARYKVAPDLGMFMWISN